MKNIIKASEERRRINKLRASLRWMEQWHRILKSTLSMYLWDERDQDAYKNIQDEAKAQIDGLLQKEFERVRAAKEKAKED